MRHDRIDMKLIDVIEELKDTYNSIDVRIFSFKQENLWKNIFTIIRFRQESVPELEKFHERLIEKCNGLIQTSEFRVDLFQFPMKNWSNMTEQLSNQILCLNNTFAVHYNNPIHFNDSVTEPYLDRNLEHVLKNWKLFKGHSESNSSSKPAYHDKLFENTLEKKFTHFDDYLSAIFQYDRYDFSSSPWINTFVPVFFKVDKITFDHNAVTVKLTTHIQKNLELTFNFFSTKRSYNGEFIDKKTKTLEQTTEKDLVQREMTIPLDTKHLGNEFEILVTTKNNILIDKMKYKINDYWKDNLEFTNPFHFVFQKYVDYQKLEQMLIECESDDLRSPDKVFERGVSWLLSLLGIQNIILGGYEKINEGSNSISTDILGNQGINNLFLINVTSGFPKPSDFDREKEHRENLLKMHKNKNVEVKSIYFTSKEPTESEAIAKTNGVLLIGRSKIKMIIDHLRKGELKNAQEIVQNFDF